MKSCKEYLEKHPDGTYSLVLRGDLCKESDILIPKGAECLTKCKDHNDDEWLLFWKGDHKFCVGHDKEWIYFEAGVSEYLDDCPGLAKVIWQREQDEPFLTPESTLNDQYAEKDNVNHPSHYTQGKVECIDALESATIGKAGIEAVCVANVIKYLWRYEEKNGLEDVKKAQFYLNRLLATLEN